MTFAGMSGELDGVVRFQGWIISPTRGEGREKLPETFKKKKLM